MRCDLGCLNICCLTVDSCVRTLNIDDFIALIKLLLVYNAFHLLPLTQSPNSYPDSSYVNGWVCFMHAIYGQYLINMNF